MCEIKLVRMANQETRAGTRSIGFEFGIAAD
jgi:hypothetical protein